MLRNRYRPTQPLGGGGFSKTYLAEDIDKLDEKCVIKQFAPQVQGTAGLQKAAELFEQEARRLQQLGEHPQIPTLLAYFKEDSRLYLVQQFIEGQDLFKELEEQGAFSEARIRNLLQDLLSILKIVHQHQVIHRDIKPENIIQRQDGKIVLIDFGASKQLKQTVVAGQGTLIGSFGYAPLEQMQGGEAYPASDLFSLGATCFHLLSGIHPWELWKSQGYGWVESWRQHLQKPVSKELGAILDKLLKGNYLERYQSAEEVLQDLANPQPQVINQYIFTPPTTPAQSSPIPSVNPVGLAPAVQATQRDTNPAYKVALILGLFVCVGAGIRFFNSQTQESKPETATLTTDTTSRTDTTSKTDTTSTTDTTNKKTEADYNTAGLAKYEKKDFRGAIEEYSQAIKINPNYEIAYYNRGLAYNDLGDIKTAIENYNQAIKINPNYGLAYGGRGLARYNLGDKRGAIEDYNLAIKNNPKDSTAYYNRGLARYSLQEKQAALADYNEAIRINPNYADAYNNRGNVRGDFGNNQAAIKDYTQAIKINPSHSAALYNRGLARYNLGDYRTAIEDYNQAIKLNPNYTDAYYGRGLARSDLGEKQAAIEDYNQTIKLDSNYSNAYYGRGVAHFDLGDRQAAIEDYNQTLKLNPTYANAYYGLGLAYNALSKKQAALDAYRKAADLYKQQGNTKSYQDSLNRIKQLEA
jgi:tetratricopeptide (TPR) repeat protein